MRSTVYITDNTLHTHKVNTLQTHKNIGLQTQSNKTEEHA